MKKLKHKVPKLITFISLLFLLGLVLGTITHEVIGHGLTAIAFGNRLTAVQILVFRFDSNGISLVPFSGFGRVFFGDTSKYDPFITLGGSLITLVVSIVFTFLLLLKKSKGIRKFILICFSLYFIDTIYNYILKPYIQTFWSIGGDYIVLEDYMGYYFPLLSIFTAVFSWTAISIIFYKSFMKQDRKITRFFFWELVILSVLITIFLTYISLVWLGIFP